MTTTTAKSARAAAKASKAPEVTERPGYSFMTKKGYRMHAWLAGEPGRRRLEFVLSVHGMPVPFGSVPLRRVISFDERERFGQTLRLGPNGDLNCRPEHRITLHKHMVDILAFWSQAVVLGREERRTSP